MPTGGCSQVNIIQERRALWQRKHTSLTMKSQPYFADEQGILRIAAVPQHGLSFEERTNGLLEQPLPLDCVLQDPTQPLHFQPADMQTHGNTIYLPGQNSFKTIFPGVQGRSEERR